MPRSRSCSRWHPHQNHRYLRTYPPRLPLKTHAGAAMKKIKYFLFLSVNVGSAIIFSQKIKVCIVSPRSLTCTLLWAPSTTSTVATVFKAAPSLTDCPAPPPPPTAPSVVESGTSGFCPNNRCRLGKTGCARLLLLSDDMEDRSSR